MWGNLSATKIAVGFCVLFCLSQALLASDGESFTVTSYIPEKFTDFEWRIDGKLNFSGNDSETDTDTAGVDYRMRANGAGNQALNARTTMKYEYVTLPVQFLTSTSLTTDFNFRTAHNSTTNQYYGGSATDVQSDYNRRSLNFNLSENVRAILYPQHNYFVSLTGGMMYSKDEMPKYDSHTDQLIYYDSTTVYDIRNENTTRQQTSSQYRYRITGELLQGIGRVEYGVYGATALYMIDELKSQGLLLRTPSFDEMKHLTDLIYYYSEVHAVDKRLRKIETLTSLLDYLKEVEAVDDAGPKEVMTIVDVWDYFPNDRREFGWRIGAGVGLRYEHRKDNSSDNISRKTSYYYYNDTDPSILDSLVTMPLSESLRNSITSETEQSPYWLVSGSYYRPIDLRWQWHIDGNAKFYFGTADDYEDVLIQYLPYYREGSTVSEISIDSWREMTLGSALTYIMNSRTSARCNGAYTYNNKKYATRTVWTVSGGIPTSEIIRNEVTAYKINLGADLEYRISIPTTLIASVDYKHSNNKATVDLESDDIDNDTWSLSAQLVHYLH